MHYSPLFNKRIIKIRIYAQSSKIFNTKLYFFAFISLFLQSISEHFILFKCIFAFHTHNNANSKCALIKILSFISTQRKTAYNSSSLCQPTVKTAIQHIFRRNWTIIYSHDRQNMHKTHMKYWFIMPNDWIHNLLLLIYETCAQTYCNYSVCKHSHRITFRKIFFMKGINELRFGKSEITLRLFFKFYFILMIYIFNNFNTSKVNICAQELREWQMEMH